MGSGAAPELIAHDLRQLHGDREFPGITDREVEQLAPGGRFIARIFASDYLTSDEFYAEREKKRQETKKRAEQRNAGKPSVVAEFCVLRRRGD